MLEQFRKLQRVIFNKHKFTYKRYFYDKINFKNRLIGILGARGVGKTTFLIQYLKSLNLPFTQKLYISADMVSIDSLFDLAYEFAGEDGKVLVIDEIHKYKNFEIELKKIYDVLDLQVIFSGSSALKIDHSKADLSRRAIIYEVEGLSFREFLELNLGIKLPVFTLEEILKNHIDIAFELLEKFNLKLNFKEYITQGYYPFYFENKEDYLLRLNETVNTVIEVDIPSIFPIEYENIVNLKKLVTLICESHPFTINVKEILAKMNMGENYRGFYKFLYYLHKAKILRLIKQKTRGDNIFTKPDKIYLNNSNLHYAYCTHQEIGTIREAFFASMLSGKDVRIPKKGDFLVDDKYIFEIGGKNKTKKQIKNIENSFVVKDDMEIGNKNIIPLWLFGFLY